MLLNAFDSPWRNLFQVKEVRQCSHVDFPCAVGSSVSVGLYWSSLGRMCSYEMCSYSGYFVTGTRLICWFLLLVVSCTGGSMDWCWQPVWDWEEQWGRLLFGTSGFQGKSHEVHDSPQCGPLVSKTRVQKISLLSVELLGYNRWLCYWKGAVWTCFFLSIYLVVPAWGPS